MDVIVLPAFVALGLEPERKAPVVR